MRPKQPSRPSGRTSKSGGPEVVGAKQPDGKPIRVAGRGRDQVRANINANIAEAAARKKAKATTYTPRFTFDDWESMDWRNNE